MDVRTPFFQNIACVLIGVLFLNPIVSTAAELALDAQAGGNAAVTQAANGVPMVNIATPNGSGLSHNKFTDFNVSQQGLILNNSAQAVVQTQLGGYVMGNPNLTGGAASLILNEVNGGSPSQLKGYTEVAGKSAHVIVANPHGISCDGCGFINTPRVTLSTGKPVVEGGRLDRFDVDGGQISIEGAGLNARNVSQFDLITRSAQINAELYASQLNVITGRNEVDVATLNATAKADDGSDKPLLAIDSSALGGMYAGAIRLVGTEAGVGVKLAGDMAASAGDIQIDANGQLSMARTAASRDLQLKAENIELNSDTFAGRSALVEASGQTQVKESLAAAQQLTVKGGELLNQGVVEAGVRADGSLNNTASLSLQSSKVTNPGTITSHGSLNSDVQTLDNRTGKLLSAGNATLNAQTLENQDGRIVAQKDLELSGNQLNNQSGEVLAQQTIKVTAANLDNQDGTVAGDALDLQLSANLNNQGGLIESASDLQLAANTLSNNGGKLRALGGEGDSRFVLGGLFNNDAGLVEIGSGAFALSSVGLSNLGGTVRHTGNQGFNLDLGDIGLAGGSFSTAGELTVQADAWSNSSQLQAERLTLAVGEFTQTASGKLLSRQSIVATGDNWTNHGSIETDGELELDLAGSYSGNGSLLSQGDLIFTAASASIGAAAKVRSGGQADFSLTSSFENRGVISAADALLLSASSLNNFGTLGAGAALLVQSNSMRNEGGLLFSGSQMQLRGDSLVNQRGDLYSVGNFSFAALAPSDQAARFSNVSGTLESEADVSIQAKLIENIRESLDIVTRKVAVQFYDRDCTDCSGDKENVRYRLREIERTEGLNVSPQSSLLAGGNLLLSSDDLANHSSLISANGNVQIDTTRFDNKGAQTGEYLITRRATSEREKSTGFIVDAVNDFNAQNWPNASANVNAQLNHILSKYLPSHTGPSVTFTPDAVQAYAAIIQAGGDVQIKAPEQLNSGVIRPSFSYVAGGSRDPGTSAPGTSIATVVTLNTQLPPDLAQQAVDPLALPGFSLPQGQNGLFQINTQVGHRYLIETNPVFASLKNFLNSDYMLGNLGYDPQTAQKRLGDGFYEQRLIREAVVARTGQRYLAGLDSDEAQFRYLMDNAIASKEALKLSLGVSLTAEQVAALTHDLVWMEEREVAGQKVLVPVLYLAQAEGRLAPNGALLQGRDVALISGGNLTNQGTLRASNNLSVTASNISNSGLMQASERLTLLATDSIRNAQGGIIAGKDVTAIALTGDIVNERTVTRHESGKRGYQHQQDFVDSAARIEASGDLTLAAGRDIQNIGSALKAGGDMQLDAGRDLVIASAQEHDLTTRKDRKGNSRSEQITQYGSEVEAGGNIELSAERDLAVIASRVSAGEDLAASAGGDVLIAAAANEDHYESHRKSGGKKVDKVESHVSQQAAELTAGGKLTVLAGNDLTAVASKLKAGDEAYLYAGNQLSLLAAQNSDYSLYDKQKKGGWGSKETQRDEVTTIRNIGTSITTGGDLTLVSEGDQLYQRARLESGNDLTLDSGGSITFEAVKDLDQESHEKSKNSWAWTSAEGKGTTDETLLQSQLIAQGDIVIQAVEGLKIDVKQVNQQSVSQTINAMVAADPELAWLKEAEQRGDVDWRQVKEVHDSFKYSHSGLGGPAMIIIAIIVTYLTAGAASGLVAGATNAAAGSTMAAATAATATTAATTAGVGNIMATAVLTSAASNAVISTINNRGNLGAVVKDVTSSDNLKGYATSAITAGVTAGVLDSAFGVTGDNVTKVTKGFDLSKAGDLAKFGTYLGAQGAVHAVTQTAVQGGSLSDNLQIALTGQVQHLLQAGVFNGVGNFAKDLNWLDGSPEKIALHAVVGGLLSEATGGDFKTGALAAGANELLIERLSGVIKGDKNLELTVSQIIGVAAATATGGDPTKAAELAKNATAYNRQLHPEEIKFASDVERVKRYAEQAGISEDAARQELLRSAAAMVDRGWDEALSVQDGNTLQAVSFLRAELSQSQSGLFHVTLAEYNNERLGLKELFSDREALNTLVRDVALVDPLAYKTDPKYFQEVLNAKGLGSQEGFGNAVEGAVSGPSKAAIWLMGAANCPSCALGDIQSAWDAVSTLPEELSYKAYLDNLHIMQGKGAGVLQQNAASSTELGVGIGLTTSPVFGGPKGVGGTVDRATTGIEWGKGIQGQGMPWENHLASQLPAGSRLPPNFKTFDFFDNATGVAISAKTLDTTTMAKVANPSQVYSSLKGNIDATVKFTEYSLGRTTLSSSQITARELQVAIPKGTTTAQWEQINRAVQYGQGKGVTVKITTVD
jgi:filamentous hemagglutinin family protein